MQRQQSQTPRVPWSQEQSGSAIEKIHKGTHVLVNGLREGAPCMPVNGVNGAVKTGMNSIILMQAASEMKTRNPHWYNIKNVSQTFQTDGKPNHVRKDETSTKTQSFLPIWKEQQNVRGFSEPVLDKDGRRMPLINPDTGLQASRPIYIPHFNGDQLQDKKGNQGRVDLFQRSVAESHIAALMEEPVSLARNVKALTIAALNGSEFKPEKTKEAKETLTKEFTLERNKDSFFKTVSKAQETVLKDIQPDIEKQAHTLAEYALKLKNEQESQTGQSADIER